MSYVEIAKSALDNANSRIEALRAENARLRRALEEIEDCSVTQPVLMMDIARAALKGDRS